MLERVIIIIIIVIWWCAITRELHVQGPHGFDETLGQQRACQVVEGTCHLLQRTEMPLISNDHLRNSTVADDCGSLSPDVPLQM